MIEISLAFISKLYKSRISLDNWLASNLSALSFHIGEYSLYLYR